MLEDKRSHDEYGGIEYGGLPAEVSVHSGRIASTAVLFTTDGPVHRMTR
jgi:hypothetical protein